MTKLYRFYIGNEQRVRKKCEENVQESTNVLDK